LFHLLDDNNETVGPLRSADAYYAPQCGKRLLSMHQLKEQCGIVDLTVASGGVLDLVTNKFVAGVPGRRKAHLKIRFHKPQETVYCLDCDELQANVVLAPVPAPEPGSIEEHYRRGHATKMKAPLRCEICLRTKMEHLVQDEVDLPEDEPIRERGDCAVGDGVGPRTVSAFHGRKYAFIWSDHTTGEAVPTFSASRAEMGVKSLTNYIVRVGKPKSVYPDLAKEFINEEFKGFLAEKQIKLRASKANRHKDHAKAENRNKKWQ
jgi:hypothetical protein